MNHDKHDPVPPTEEIRQRIGKLTGELAVAKSLLQVCYARDKRVALEVSHCKVREQDSLDRWLDMLASEDEPTPDIVITADMFASVDGRGGEDDPDEESPLEAADHRIDTMSWEGCPHE